MFKTLCAICCFSVLSISSFSQTSVTKIDSIKALISREQYLSAYRLMQTIQEPSPELVLVVADIVIDHASGTNKFYDKWILKDYVAGQTKAQADIELDLEKVIVSFMKMYPKDCRISSALSRFYIKIFDYEGLYVKLADLKEIEEIEKLDIPEMCFDHYYYYVMGYCNNYLGRPQAAVEYLQKSIVYHTRFTLSYIELAYGYLQTKNFPISIKYGKKAFELATKAGDKSRSALLMAQAYEAQHDNKNALANYLLADSLNQKQFFNQKALMAFYVKTGDAKTFDAVNSFLGSQSRDNLHNYMDVLEAFTAANRQTDLAMYCQKALEQYQGRTGVEACLNFTLGKIYQSINATMAKQYFKTAKDKGIEPKKYSATRNHPITGKEIEEAFRGLN